MTTTQPSTATLPDAGGAQHGLGAHSHVGGRTVRSSGIESHLHPIGSTAVDDHPVPTAKAELWRFAPLRRLRGLHADAEFDAGPVPASWTAPAGVEVRRVTGDEARALHGASGYVPTDRFSARVFAETADSLLIDIPADFSSTEPVVITSTGADAARVHAGHIVIRLGTHADAVVVLDHAGSATSADVVEIVAADGARANVVTHTDWNPDTVQLAHYHLRVGRDASVRHSALTFGGDVVRIAVDVTYDGPGGEVELLGLYFADSGQYLEHRVFIDHAVPHCKSEVLYKGALQGERAHTAWVGDVLIRKEAEGTDSYETNRNLVLTDGARADSVPNLEIETGEIIKAAHASATGRFDDDQLFYLQSRGISAEMAKRLVVRGFFHEVLHKVGVPSIEERVSETVERELAITGN